ncbi:MAG: hypothetical protein ACREH7_02620 [Candidatus Rokuibacteriota bacterium]
MRRYLIIVARDQPALCQYLAQNFAGDDKVQVLRDRRRGERRQRVEPHEPERRREGRRHRLTPDRDLRYRSIVIIRTEE